MGNAVKRIPVFDILSALFSVCFAILCSNIDTKLTWKRPAPTSSSSRPAFVHIKLVVNLTTLFLGRLSLSKRLVLSAYTFTRNIQLLLESAEGENDRRNYFMKICGRVSNQRPLNSQSNLLPNTNKEYRISTNTVRKTPTLLLHDSQRNQDKNWRTQRCYLHRCADIDSKLLRKQ